MSSNDKDKKKKVRMFALLGAVFAIGFLAAALIGSQLSSVAAQTAGQQTSKNDSGASSSVAGSYNNNSKSAVAPFYYNPQIGGPATISTSGSASTKVIPDKFSVTAGVETDGNTAQEASSKNADLMAKVVSGLKDLGIGEDQISTSNFIVYPIYDNQKSTQPCIMIYPPPPECRPNPVIIGYKASNSVTLTLDVGKIDAGKVIDRLMQSGANNVNGVYFFISTERQQQVRDSLIKDAIANAKHKAEVATGALGMTISGVQSVNLNEVYFPIYSKSFDAGMVSAEGGGALSATQIIPGQQEINMSVSVVFYFNNITPSDSGGTTPGMLGAKDNTNCVNPIAGPAIC